MQVVIIFGVHPDENVYSSYASLWMERLLSSQLLRGLNLNVVKLSLFPFSVAGRNRLYEYCGFYFDLNRVFIKSIRPNAYELMKAVELLSCYNDSPINIAQSFIDSSTSLGLDLGSIIFGTQSIYNGFFGFSNSILKEVCLREMYRIGNIILASLSKGERLIIIDMHAGLGEKGEIGIVHNRHYPVKKFNGYFCEMLQHYVYDNGGFGSSLYIVEVGIDGTMKHFSKVLYESLFTSRYLASKQVERMVGLQGASVKPSVLIDDHQIQETMDLGWINAFKVNEIRNTNVIRRIFEA